MNAYKKFAYYYDEVMAQLEYELWYDFVLPYLKQGDNTLDLACDTGILSTMLKLKGFDAEGLDLSETIIEIALEKAKINHLQIPFYVKDMTDFNLNKQYNLITCFFDSVNFLKTKNDLNNMFECVKKHLKPNGYFIFDIFSKDMMIEYENNHLKEDHHTFKIDWKTKRQDHKTLKHEIIIYEGDYELKETYYEYYHELKNMNLSGFKLIKICGDFNDDYQPGDERILVVLQKC